MFITEKDKEILKTAKRLIEIVYQNINFDFKEFTLISTAIDSIEYAIEKENIFKENNK